MTHEAAARPSAEHPADTTITVRKILGGHLGEMRIKDTVCILHEDNILVV